MTKKILALITIFLSLIFVTRQAMALTLDTIGSSSTTNGSPGTEWWYTAENPVLGGTAAAASSVSIDIDATAYPVTADSSGNWSYAPTTLTTGDHTVTITGDNTSIAFTLHAGQALPSSSGGSVSTGSGTLPVSGAVTNTIVLIGTGVILLALGFKLKNSFAE